MSVNNGHGESNNQNKKKNKNKNKEMSGLASVSIPQNHLDVYLHLGNLLSKKDSGLAQAEAVSAEAEADLAEAETARKRTW